MKPVTKAAQQLFMDGIQAYSRMEGAGIRIDVDYLDRAMVKLDENIKVLTEEMKQDETYDLWKRTFGDRTNMGSRAQLGHIVFDLLEHPCTERTKTGKPKTDEDAFDDVDLEFVEQFLEVEKWKKAKSTFLMGIKRETVQGFLHGSYWLNIARTYRSSASEPDMQNFPIRDPHMMKMIRRSFIARKGRRLVEGDFSGIEVRVAGCVTGDPVLITYIKDETKDMHRDCAMQIYKLKQEQVTKDIRHSAKNQYVFPQFYGSYYGQCAPHLWRESVRRKMMVGDITMKEHLAKKGIKERGACDKEKEPVRGTFEHHIKQIDDDFWNNRFRVYGQRRREWLQEYRARGWMQMATGFTVFGVMSKNQIINYRIQGPAFHCLLWCHIQLDNWLRRNKMKTLIVGTIHDSLILDAPDDELEDVVYMMIEIMTVLLPREWPWIIVPLKVDVEVAPVGGSWANKEKYHAA